MNDEVGGVGIIHAICGVDAATALLLLLLAMAAARPSVSASNVLGVVPLPLPPPLVGHWRQRCSSLLQTEHRKVPTLAVAFSFTPGLAEEYVPCVVVCVTSGKVRAAALRLLSVSAVRSSCKLTPFTFVTAVLQVYVFTDLVWCPIRHVRFVVFAL